MSTMNCSDFQQHIDEWIEGMEVPGARDHSRECADCRGLAEALGSIRLTASTMFESDPEISPRVWNAIRTQLVEEGIIKTHGRQNQPRKQTWLSLIFDFVPRPALAAAWVGAVAVAGLMLTGPVHIGGTADSWHVSTHDTEQLNAQLDDAEKSAVASLTGFSPDVTNDLRRNLSIVDNDIALCEKSVQEAPDSEIARDYLYGAYQQKADLLAQISERGEEGQ